jgi:PleD family two-component response regulator
MILAVLDDLLFTSKIRSVAGHLGVPLSVARSIEGALGNMREHPPSLVILDLTTARIDTLGIVAAMKADAVLTRIPTLGFAGHTQTELFDAARKAGVSQVLTRGAFAERLPEIIGAARANPT